MKKNKFLLLFESLSLIVLFLTVNTFDFAQSTKTNEDNGNQSLQGLTEAILIDGQPVLRIISRNNGSTEVKTQKRDNEDALVFSVFVVQRGFVNRWHLGKLFVTKTKIVFDPNEDNKNFFSLQKSEIKGSKLTERSKAFTPTSYINLQSEKLKRDISINFTLETQNNKEYAIPSNNFLLESITDFDVALSKFNQLTTSVRPKEEDEEINEEVESEITDKYDRFRDVTIVSTSKMLVEGSRRSIRIYANYTIDGKNQKNPTKITLYFYASAARPLFSEDDLQLNFLVDNKRTPLGDMSLTEEEKTKTITKQTLKVDIPYETFEQIAKGNKVEFQIGTLEYKLTDIHIEAFRKFLNYKIKE